MNSLYFACSLAITSAAFAQCQYEAIPLPETCNGAWSPLGINDHSTVVGYQIGCTSASWKPFIWTAETGTNYLPWPQVPGIVDVGAVTVANDGTIAGYAKKSNGLSNLIVWKPGGTVTIYYPGGASANVSNPSLRFDGAVLGEYQTGFPGGIKGFILKDEEFLPLPAPLARAQGGFHAVNRSGWATGRYFIDSAVEDQPIVWDGESEAILLGVPDGYSHGRGMEISCCGNVACQFFRPASRKLPTTAWHAYVWEAGKYTMIPLLPGLQWGTVEGMNDVGQVIGEGSKPDSPRAYLYQNGTTTLLSSLITPAYTGLLSDCYDINEKGEITAKDILQMYLLRPIGVVPADVDINCRVDVDDLNFLFRCWGPVGTTTPERADVNGDGWVDAADLAEVLGAWTP